VKVEVEMPRSKAPARRPLLKQKDAAAYIGFTARQFRRWIEEGKLPIDVIKMAGRNYFDPDDLDRFRESLPRYNPALGSY
jgi:hypothetical protein